MRTFEIAVCGAGIGGLASALALVQRGHRVTVFEKVQTPVAVGSGLMLQPTGQAALGMLGILDDVMEHGRVLEGIAGKTRSGRTIFDIKYGVLGPDVFGIGIHRGTLFHILEAACRRHHIPIVASIDVATSVVSGDKRCVVTAAGVTCGRFDLVVDATGLNSPLRAAYGQIRLQKPYPYGAVWGVVAEPEGWAHKRTLSQCYDGARVMVGVLPIGRLPGRPDPLAAFFWSLRTSDFARWRATDFAAWQNEVAQVWPAASPFVGQFKGHGDLATAAYADVWLKSPHADRLVFVGDSARAASPQLGQGANLALLDAVVLAACLADHAVVNEALHAYGAFRRAHTRFYGLASRWLTPFFQSDSHVAAMVRDATFSHMARIPYLRREMIRTLSGVKTGLLRHATPTGLAGLRSKEPAVAARPTQPKPTRP